MQLQVHPIKFVRPLIRRLPQIETMFRHDTKNTFIPCPVCRPAQSRGLVAIKSYVTNTFTVKKCGFCGGNKQISNRWNYDPKSD